MYLEAIKLKRKRVFEKLKRFPEFYLGGGTALALQMGHRISVDFDLFSQKDIPSDFLDKIKKLFENSKIIIFINHSEQLSVKVDGTRIDFVKYNFPFIFEPIKFQGVNILQIPEIAAMKAYTLGRRATFKDYVDLYFILKEKHITIEEITKIAKKKYKDEFDSRLFLEQLIFFEDIKKMKLEFLKEKVNKKEIQKFFEEEVGKLKL